MKPLKTLRRVLSGLFSSREETFQEPLEKEKPKTMLQTFLPYLIGEIRNVQFLNEQGKLTSFKKYQGTKNVLVEFDSGDLTIHHCSKEPTKLSKALTLGLETSLQSRIEYIQESLQSGNLKRVGEALNGSLLGEGVDCRSCKTRFALRIMFDPKKVHASLEKLRDLKPT